MCGNNELLVTAVIQKWRPLMAQWQCLWRTDWYQW